jgi:hypothetical protein
MMRMKSSSLYLIIIALLLFGGIALAKCNGSDSKRAKAHPVDSSSPVGPAPDNNSANNPSLADTNYEKDRTRPITDTMKKKK